jgi:hypothetical protein
MRFDRIPAPPRQAGVVASLLANRKVQEELNVTAEQQTRYDEQLALLREERNRHRSKITQLPRDLTLKDRVAKQAEIDKALLDSEAKFIDDCLTDAQKIRFRQIVLQGDGVHAFGRDEVLQALKLTPDQTDKIARIVLHQDNEQVNIQMSGRGGNPPLSRLRELSRESVEKAVAVLTDEQKKVWGKLIGEAYGQLFER